LPVWKLLDASCARLNSEGTYDGSWHVRHPVPPDAQLDKPVPLFRNDKLFKRWVRASPIVDELTLELAVSLFKRYQLGHLSAPDLLAISLSATDYIGHRYGNEGPEMCDQMAHLDRELGALFRTLDASKVRYLVVLAADHGGIDAAERVQLKGFPAERMTTDVAAAVNQYLRGSDLQLGFDPFEYVSYGLYFRRNRSFSAEERQSDYRDQREEYDL
jgi:predicted AlkP superfamily pyrophosphatase or phosphodiesterase